MSKKIKVKGKKFKKMFNKIVEKEVDPNKLIGKNIYILFKFIQIKLIS